MTESIGEPRVNHESPDAYRCDRIVNNGFGEPTECGRAIPCEYHDLPADPTRGAASPPTPRTEAARELFAWLRETPSATGYSLTVLERIADGVRAVESEARGAAPLDVAALTETLRYLYHADEPCDAPNKHRHEWIALGIAGQYPRFAVRLFEGPIPPTYTEVERLSRPGNRANLDWSEGPIPQQEPKE